MSNCFFLNVFKTLFKTQKFTIFYNNLEIITPIFSERKNQDNYCCDQNQPKNLYRFYFDLQKLFILDRPAINFFIYIRVGFIPNIIFFLRRHHIKWKNKSILFIYHNILHKHLFYEAFYAMV